MKKWLPFFFSLLFLLAFPIVSSASTTLEEMKDIIKLNYVGEIDGDLESATTIDQVMEMLDPYSTYFTAEEFEEFINAIEMTVVGIGVSIEQHEQGILITNVFESGSAYEAGVLPGDIIITVDGQSIEGQPIEQVQPLIVGAENTEVSIKVLKEDGTIVDYTIFRKPFTLPIVTSDLLYGNVGYISMTSFSENAATLVKKEYNNLRKEGATSFIVDLQNNGGGYVTTAEQLIGMFPGATNAYKIKFSPKNTSDVAKSSPFNYRLQDDGTLMVKSSFQLMKFPSNTRLLVNRFSASASEMTAAALVDQEAAILYGEDTYGKGTMQTFYELQDGSYLKLTIGEFFGPNNSIVKNVGIKPHVETTENPIYKAHFDSIVDNLSNYQQLKSLENVSTSKKFTITFSNPIEQQIAPSTVTLVELGGNKIEATLEISENKIVVTPTKSLIAGGHYMLIVNPTIKYTNGKDLINGVYMYITVKE